VREVAILGLIERPGPQSREMADELLDVAASEVGRGLLHLRVPPDVLGDRDPTTWLGHLSLQASAIYERVELAQLFVDLVVRRGTSAPELCTNRQLALVLRLPSGVDALDCVAIDLAMPDACAFGRPARTIDRAAFASRAHPARHAFFSLSTWSSQRGQIAAPAPG